ncbi:MAG: type II toxin-antitoxin system PemK/MazF family toxin [Desulfuromonadales bacterium]|nr:type II toxin-antitoxin system PemK/MazF family toxin [Desulfuromonadales bacterium]
MAMKRGEIWWADLPNPVASEPGYRRPLVIVQIDEFNRSRINTVVVVVLTTNLRLAEAPGNVLLKSVQTGLPKDSVANASQVLTVDKSFLTEKAGKLRKLELQKIESGLRLVMGL